MIGDYTMGKQLPCGMTSKVYLARHQITKEQVVLKQICKPNAQDETTTLALCEIAALKLLEHPNIIQLLDVLETSTHLFLVLEYAEQGDLFDLITSDAFEHLDRFGIMQQLLNAVEFCHSERIAHRDLKIENVLLDKNGQVKLADFGFAKLYDTDEFASQYCGTYTSVPPEMLTRKSWNPFQADIWSLGVLFYIIMCGYAPFPQAEQEKELTLDLIKHGKYYHLPQETDSLFVDLIDRMFQVDPEKRSTVSQLQQHPWFFCQRSRGNVSSTLTSDSETQHQSLSPLCSSFPKPELRLQTQELLQRLVSIDFQEKIRTIARSYSFSESTIAEIHQHILDDLKRFDSSLSSEQLYSVICSRKPHIFKRAYVVLKSRYLVYYATRLLFGSHDLNADFPVLSEIFPVFRVSHRG